MPIRNIPVFYPERILSASNTPKLLNWTLDCLEDGFKTLLIDFRYVVFMDSSGLGALVTAHRYIKQEGGRLLLCSLQGQARMVFDMSNLQSAFELYESQDDFSVSKLAR